MSAPNLDDVAELPVWFAWQGTAAQPGALPRKVAYASADCARCAAATDPKDCGRPVGTKPNVREFDSLPVCRGERS